MARGRKKEINYGQEIEMMERKISYHQNALDLLEKKKQELSEQDPKPTFLRSLCDEAHYNCRIGCADAHFSTCGVQRW